MRPTQITCWIQYTLICIAWQRGCPGPDRLGPGRPGPGRPGSGRP